MNIDLGSFAFGSYLNSGSGTPSWGTALGQSRPDYKFTYPGAEVLLIGMVYCSVPLDRVSLPLGKGGRIYQASELDECQLASLFRKVYINGIRINYPFLMVLVREESDSHTGRRSIKYSDKNSYQFNGERFSNQEFIQQVRRTLNLADDACWFIYSIEVYNQDELHMSAVIVDENNSVEYENSSERKNKWLELIPDSGEDTIISKSSSTNTIENLQQIFYGAPGTGKSHKINNDEKVKEANKKNLVFRTTFHPDSDYSTFVGAYKPTMQPVADKYKAVAGKEEEITYSFVPQAFLQAYIAAWNNPEENVYLVIEEINRGNCAQIFGDLFQLLDRDNEGCSEYPIMADKDLAKYLNGKDEEGEAVLSNKDGIKDGKLRLPKNLYIWATMNTSDQSLFPIDSAFKRRWDWKYIPIADAMKNYVIDVDGDQYDWWSFINIINTIVEKTIHSEDKKLGYFFAKAKDSVISVDTFVSKVIFYLWNDVFKDYDCNHKAFKDENGELIAFHKFYRNDGTINTDVVINFLKDLEVDPFEDSGNGSTLQAIAVPNSKRNRDKSRYKVNNVENLIKSEMTRHAFQTYIDTHQDEDAKAIAQAWNGLGLKNYIPHLVETEEDFIARTKDSIDPNKRATEFILSNDEKIYLSTQFGIGNIGKFIDAVNNAGWNIRIEKMPDKV